MDAVNFDQNSSLENEETDLHQQKRAIKAEDIKGELEQKSLKRDTKCEDNHIKGSIKVSKENLLEHHKASAKEECDEPQIYKKLHIEVVAQNGQPKYEAIINKNSTIATPNGQQNQHQAMNVNKGFQVVNPGFVPNNSLNSINQSQFLMQQQPSINSMNMPILFNSSQQSNNPIFSADNFGVNGQLINVMPQQNYVIKSNNNMMPMFMYPNQMQNKLFPTTMNVPQANFINTTSNGTQDCKLSNNEHHLSKLIGNSNLGIQTPMPYYIPNMQLQTGLQPNSMNGIQVIPTFMYVFATPQPSNFQGFPQGLNLMSSQNLLFNGGNYNIANVANQGTPLGANLPSAAADNFGFHEEKMLQKNISNPLCTTANGQGKSTNEWDSSNILHYMLDPSKRVAINAEK